MQIEIVRSHVGDYLSSSAIRHVLNQGHDKRIRQSILDFYRNDWKVFNNRKKSGGEILFLIAIGDSLPVGISACAIPRKDNKVWNSMTVVHPENRRKGIGRMLLKAKLDSISDDYPNHVLKTFVSKKNEPSLKLCVSSGLHIVGEGFRKREGKESTEFYVLSQNRVIHDE